MIEIHRKGTRELLARLDGSLDGADLSGRDLTGADFGGAARLQSRLLTAPVASTWWVPLAPLVPALAARRVFGHLGAPASGRMLVRALAVASLPFGYLFAALLTLLLLPILALEPLFHRQGKSSSLRRTNLSGATLREADLRGAELIEANLQGADLTGADLSAPRLLGGRTQRTHLSNCDLRGSRLDRADLSGAFITQTDLSGASLSGACLRGAVLVEADLRGSDLTGADFTEAQLIDAWADETTRYDNTTRWPANFTLPARP